MNNSNHGDEEGADDGHIRSATLILALRARGFDSISESLGTTGRRVITFTVARWSHRQIGVPGGQMQSDACFRMKFFTILSSSEW